MTLRDRTPPTFPGAGRLRLDENRRHLPIGLADRGLQPLDALFDVGCGEAVLERDAEGGEHLSGPSCAVITELTCRIALSVLTIVTIVARTVGSARAPRGRFVLSRARQKAVPASSTPMPIEATQSSSGIAKICDGQCRRPRWRGRPRPPNPRPGLRTCWDPCCCERPGCSRGRPRRRRICAKRSATSCL